MRVYNSVYLLSRIVSKLFNSVYVEESSVYLVTNNAYFYAKTVISSPSA